MVVRLARLPDGSSPSQSGMVYGMSEQVAIRLPDQQLAFIDELVGGGRFPSRAEAIRTAIAAMIDAEHRRALGRRIVEGYERTPQTDQELASAAAAATASIADEPW